MVVTVLLFCLVRAGLMREMLPGYDNQPSEGEAFDPNCFEVYSLLRVSVRCCRLTHLSIVHV
jgi:hypothetical protein